MKLQTYFNSLGNETLSDERKFLLYQKICEKREVQPQTLKRANFFVRHKVYTTLSLLFICAFFGLFFFDTPTLEYRAFRVEKTPSGSYIANADSIAEILDFNGEYLIEKEGKTFQNSVIFDGDIISLKDNAKIIFNINDHIKAEIQGPARFKISKIEEGRYRISLLEGNYLKVDSEQNIDILEVETEDIFLETSENEEIALELAKNDEKLEIKNTGASVSVKNNAIVNAEKVILETEKLLTMDDNDITTISDIETFSNALSQGKNLTYTATHPKIEEKEIDKDIEEVVNSEILELINDDTSFLTSSDNMGVNKEEQENISSALAYETDEILVPTEAQLSKVNAALNAGFLLSDIQVLYEAKLDGDTSKENTAYKNLLWRLKSVGEGCGVSVGLENTPTNLLKQIDTVYQGLQKYYFPPSKGEQLLVLKDWIKFLENNTVTDSWGTFKENLPGNLKFK